jgi:segregation and condensation protein B
MDRRLVKIVGRAEELGRPMLYGTTRTFLQIFGLASLGDLPEVEGLVREPSWKPAAPPAQDAETEDAADETQEAETTEPTPEITATTEQATE